MTRRPYVDLTFGSLVNIMSHPWGQIPQNTQKGALIGILKPNSQNKNWPYYRNYCTASNQILYSDKDHRILFVGGPNTRKRNPRWRTATIDADGYTDAARLQSFL